MSSDKMRAEFEAWANSFFANAPTKYKRDALPKDDPNYGDYVSMPLQAAWQAWQASRAEPVVAPAVQGEPEYGSTPQYINDAIDNLAHANYELSYAGYQERTRDVELIRAYVARTLQPAEQQPDVTQLVEALESAKNLIANHSGEVLPDEYAGDQIEQIDGALSAYREGGEE